ncbi:hypothetical protein BMR07_08715 [Methylococcaceae bacterium CS1]|nr:hypothetical protein BMR10_08430 [Methylococcaceae bacterium CS4]TXK97789.1 hypothetical protein BMR11_09670 [Methylococcaceae bacterium CS5]TXL05770.1 hypothetical protein BMR07_08715 [Methylococcaceae bacterium CS1]TXL08123.1 hypothetical protein BMR09_03700 [Methylococcaceae bacterium CS3]TXL10308.1 hypothetical protein BMR08_09920 [Methylococcaceae bacterium CS2]
MRLKIDKLERVKFLSRVVKKEIHHLNYSASKVFNQPFTIERAKKLANDQEQAEQVEAFTSRFCRLQDTIGDKLLPAWLEILSERSNVAIDNLDKAEKIGVLPSVELWLELRQLRNQMIHEYIEDLTLLVDALQIAYKNLEFIVDVAESIIKDLDKRINQAG